MSRAYFLMCLLTVLGSCQTASNNTAYRPVMSPDELAASERHIEQVEDTARRHVHEDRMSRAEADELSTRHAPTHVSRSSSTTIIPFFW